jgi:peptidoglycan/LPS O-acetylase OafA/YrhL
VKFRSDIEGLRAVAIVPVVLYRASSGLVPGGYIGVDVFFVISGFLISKIILDGVDNGTFSYRSFYERRIRRIFPALFFMLAGVSLASLFILSPGSLKEFGVTLAATALFVSNMEFPRLSGYFGGAAELKPLLHTWSLAVEEQFYIFFPAVLVATKRWLRSRFLAVILACGAISFLTSVWLVMRHPATAFYFGHSRAFELMMGAALALDALPQLSRMSREIVAGAGLCMIAVGAFAFDRATPFPGINAVLPCLGAAAVVYAGQSGQSAMAALLSLPPIRFVGAISYSLYLWHWPILSLARNYYLIALTPFQTFCAVLLAVVMAVISWRFVERPFLAGERPRRSIFVRAGAVMAAALALSAILIPSEGLPARFSPESQRLFLYSDDVNPRRGQCNGDDRRSIPYAKNCYFGAAAAHDVVAVWGDSHGMNLSVALGEIVGPGRSVMEITATWCPPALDFDRVGKFNCDAHNRETITNLLADPHVRTVVLVARYGAYSRSIVWPNFKTGFEKAISELVASRKHVIVVYPVPVYPHTVPDAVGMMVARGIPPESYVLALSKYREENSVAIVELDAVTAKFHLSRVATEGVFCRQQYCFAYDGHDVLYMDDNHLSVSGARKLAAAIKPLL